MYKPLAHIIGDRALRETRSIAVRGRPGLPDGEYGFLELYCVDPACDCRRVIIWVVRKDTRDFLWAAINYGFEDIEFYRRWMTYDGRPEELVGAHLDDMSRQSEFAPALLELFCEYLPEEGYDKRLRAHYHEVKELVQQSSPKAPKRHSRRPRRRR